MSVPEEGAAAPPALHELARTQLAEAIAHGEYPPESKLPSERTLCEMLGVSRVTLRRALTALARQGLIAAAHGRGWYVTQQRVSEPPNLLMSFSRMARSQGLTPSSRVFAQIVRPASIDEAQALSIAPGAALFELWRLRALDDIPVALDHSRVPLSVAPGVEAEDFATGSLHAALARRGAAPYRSDTVVEAVAADAEQAAALEMQSGQPLLSVTQTTYDRTGRPVELGAITYRGDRYRFRSTITLPESEDG